MEIFTIQQQQTSFVFDLTKLQIPRNNKTKPMQIKIWLRMKLSKLSIMGLCVVNSSSSLHLDHVVCIARFVCHISNDVKLWPIPGHYLAQKIY